MSSSAPAVSWTQQTKLTADDGAAGDGFGGSVDLSPDGNSAVIGSSSADADHGAAYIFNRSGVSWTQQSKLTATDGASSDYFGATVALSGDALTALVGAPAADVGGPIQPGGGLCLRPLGRPLDPADQTHRQRRHGRRLLWWIRGPEPRWKYRAGRRPFCRM